jgi:hypothetical protein
MSVVGNWCAVNANLQACSSSKEYQPVSRERGGTDDDLEGTPRVGFPGELQGRHHPVFTPAKGGHRRIAVRGEHHKVVHGADAYAVHDPFGKAHLSRAISNGPHEQSHKTDHQQ